MASDIQITFKDKVYDVAEGFTAEEYKDVLASQPLPSFGSSSSQRAWFNQVAA